jgi:hypothetical protein
LDAFIQHTRQCKEQGQNIYQVMLILTDGAIHDMETTK